MRAYLRAATQPAHSRLEGTLGLLDEGLDRAAYMKVLERFYGFWRGWEPQIAALLQDEPFLEPRRRMHLLKADLAVLGSSACMADALPECPLTSLTDARGALGSLYVLEGSTLGGRVIQRNVERCLGLGEQSACTYFAGYGTNTGAMWRSFLTRLDEAAVADAEDIAAGAIATFERLADWLSEGADRSADGLSGPRGATLGLHGFDPP